MDDLFPDGQHVWLRSRLHGTYLHADEDGHGVSLSPRRASMSSAWAVHLRHGNDQHVLLHSAATGRYLAATLASAPGGCRGFRVEQRNYDNLEDEAIGWQPLRIGPGDEIMLRHHDIAAHRYGYLRANGKLLIWNANGVSVDDFHNISDMMDWVVVPIPTRERIPRLPRPSGLDHLHGRLSVLLPSREMMFFGDGDGAADFSFTFRGRSVFRLRNELVSRLRINNADDANNLVMYVRAGTYGRFTPLVADLPSSRQPLTIRAEIADNGPRYPDFAAE